MIATPMILSDTSLLTLAFSLIFTQRSSQRADDDERDGEPDCINFVS